MNGVTTPQAQASVRVELMELPGGTALAARAQDGKLHMLLNPEATPERLREDLASILGHLLDHGLITWNEPQEQGLP